jgi:hypothetical protein
MNYFSNACVVVNKRNGVCNLKFDGIPTQSLTLSNTVIGSVGETNYPIQDEIFTINRLNAENQPIQIKIATNGIVYASTLGIEVPSGVEIVGSLSYLSKNI